MQQSSLSLQDAVTKTYTKIDRVLMADQHGQVFRELEATAGEVTAANDAEQTRRFTADVADPTGELTPYALEDEMAPFGTEAIVQTGARIPVHTEEVLVVEDAAGWNSGTRSGTSVSAGGGLVLGNI